MTKFIYLLWAVTCVLVVMACTSIPERYTSTSSELERIGRFTK